LLSEGLSAHRHLEREMIAVTCQHSLQMLLERGTSVQVVEANVDLCGRIGRNQVGRSIANIHACQLQRGGPEVVRALVEPGGHQLGQGVDYPMNRVVYSRRVSDVTLRAFNRDGRI
jgi:hypothetical protein